MCQIYNNAFMLEKVQLYIVYTHKYDIQTQIMKSDFIAENNISLRCSSSSSSSVFPSYISGDHHLG